ncbi:MAG: GNAT family N-acetyltransferase [Aureispira sp.]|nr:GNAT family N-acetyltransferase [Aureispira sp.]
MQNNNIQVASIDQLSKIKDLYTNCRLVLQQMGLQHQWYDFYPPVSTIQQDIEEQTLFVLQNNTDLMGVMVLNEVQFKGYEEVDWQHQGDRILVIHRIAVAPQHQGKGYARKLLQFAENHAKKHNYTAIRLDAYSQNSRLLKFYTRMDYQRTKEVIFLGQPWEHPFVCFEKKIEL